MRTDLLARLKALANGDDRKVRALLEFWTAKGLDEATLEHVIGQMEHDRITAKEMHIAYKGDAMSKSKFPDYEALERVYDVVDRVKERHGMPASVAVAEALVRVGLDLEAGRAVLKDGKATYKSATSPELATSLKAALDLLGESGLVMALKALVAQRQAATKAAADPWQNPDFSNMAPR